MVFDLLKLLLCWFSLKFIFGSLNCFLLKWNSMKIWGFSYLGTTLDFALFPCGKTPPKPPLHLVINLSPLSQLIQTSFGFYSNYFSLSNQFWKLSWAQMIFKASTILHLSFDLKPTLLDSPLYPQPRTILIHSSSFQNFQNSASASLDQICQIWWNSYLYYSKNSTKIQATYVSNEKPLHQVSAQGKIPRCLDHSVEHLACTVLFIFS